MATNQVNLVFIFGSKDDPLGGWEKALILRDELETAGMHVRLINKLTSILEDLQLVALYRIVKTPTIIILSPQNEVLGRISDLPSVDLLRKLQLIM